MYRHCPHPDGGDDVAGSHDLGLAAAPGVHTEPEQEQVQVLETGEVLTRVKMQWSIGINIKWCIYQLFNVFFAS